MSPAPIEPTGFFTGIRIRPIIIGVVVDTVATILFTTLYGNFVVLPALVGKAGTTEDLLAAYWVSSEGLMASLILGSLGTLAGGFYAAYKAGTLQMKHGALVGIGSIILGLILNFGGAEGEELPEWFMALSFAAAIPAGALGGFFAEMLIGVTGGNSAGGGGSAGAPN